MYESLYLWPWDKAQSTQNVRFSRPNWFPPPTHRQTSVAYPPPPSLDPRGETHSLVGEGAGRPNSDEGN
jgi:hypothetical protein